MVDGVSFSVDCAEIVGLLGPNGAGKTTSFRMTCGMIEPDAGTVTLNGIDVTNWPMYRRAKEGGMGYLAQEVERLPQAHRRAEPARRDGAARHGPRPTRSRRCDELLEQFEHHAHPQEPRPARSPAASGGGWKSPAAWSPTRRSSCSTSRSPASTRSRSRAFRRSSATCKARGISILITDHQVRETLQITDRSYVIHKGKVLCHGTPEVVLANPKARELYFGSNMDVDWPAQSAVGTSAACARAAPQEPRPRR